VQHLAPPLHRFVWADLASADDARAIAFYRALFGWTDVPRTLRGGRFCTFERSGRAFGSIYRLERAQVARGIPSHWTPYISTVDMEATVDMARALGACIVMPPQEYPGLARVALIADPAGALLGLWQDKSDLISDWTGAAPARGDAR